MTRSRLRAVLAAAVAVVATAAVGVPAMAAPDGGGGPGDIVSAERVTVPNLPNATATKIHYRSTDTFGAPNVVSGILLKPTAPPPGGEKVIGYAVGTHGLADRCAPSAALQAGTDGELAVIAGLVARGYTVAVTDYEGLGTPGEHTYLLRATQAQALLDVVRAASRVEGGVAEGTPAGLWGYSQGGAASAAAAELAGEYAPELNIVGAFAGAPPSDLAATARLVDGTLTAGLLGYAVSSFEVTYPELGIRDLLNDRGNQMIDELRGQCGGDSIKYAGLRSEALTDDGRPLTDHMDEEPIRSRVDEQLIGLRTPTMPVLIAHSFADEISPTPPSYKLAERWCEKGADVELRIIAVPTHAGAIPESQARAFAFMEKRFAGLDTASTCT